MLRFGSFNAWFCERKWGMFCEALLKVLPMGLFVVLGFLSLVLFKVFFFLSLTNGAESLTIRPLGEYVLFVF